MKNKWYISNQHSIDVWMRPGIKECTKEDLEDLYVAYWNNEVKLQKEMVNILVNKLFLGL